MKKVLSLILALVMAASLGLPAFADNEVAAEDGYNTKVEYVGKGKEAYTLTVPATLVPTEGENSGDVILSGTWNSTRQITVSADTKVTLSTKFGDSKELAITFAGIVLPGSNTEAVSKTEPVSVETMTALFGDWNGTFYYNVEAGDVPKYDATFANNTWEEIATACQNDEVPESWAVGDTKAMTINGKEYEMRIVGKNHDDYTDGSGKAPLTIGLAECYDWGVMNDTATNVGGWKESKMRTVTLPAILEKMPAEVQSAIKAVDKKAGIGGGESSDLETVSDKLFLFAACEIGLSPGGVAIKNDGTTYEIFSSGLANRYMPELEGNSESKQWWFTRSVSTTQSTSFYATCNGIAGNRSANMQQGIVFGFCF